MHHISELYTLLIFHGTLMQNSSSTRQIVHYLLPVYLVRYQAIHLDISGANRFDPFNITSYGCQVLIAICSDQDVILDSDTTDRFVFFEDIMIDMLRISYRCQ